MGPIPNHVFAMCMDERMQLKLEKSASLIMPIGKYIRKQKLKSPWEEGISLVGSTTF